MEYKIYCDGKENSRFVHEDDRDRCLDCLAEFYKDSAFTTEA